MNNHPAELCQTCGGSRLVMMPGKIAPEPCPACGTAGVADVIEDSPMDVLDTLVVVRPPEGVTIPHKIPANGLVMVAPGHVPGIGGVLRIVAVDALGNAQSITLAPGGLAKFSGLINGAARRLQTGEFDLPPRAFPGESVQ